MSQRTCWRYQGSGSASSQRGSPEIADGRLSLFNEVEVEAKKNAPEPCIEVPAHQRRKKQKDHTAELLAKFPHEERLITLPEEERVCKRYGTALTSMGKEKICTEIEFIPAKVIDYYRESFQCLACRKESLQAFLKSGNAALSNNICERAIRNFTIGRKNWLFSDSPKGAKASAAVYSIIETAKANGLNPFRYFQYLFEHLPNADI